MCRLLDFILKFSTVHGALKPPGTAAFSRGNLAPGTAQAAICIFTRICTVESLKKSFFEKIQVTIQPA
jgi:hypothetical protein